MKRYLLILTALVLTSCSSRPGFLIKEEGVYFVSSEGTIVPVKGANPKTFQVLPLLYGRDGEKFFRAWEPLEGGYLGSYKPEGTARQSQNALYSKDGRVLICDYPTFKEIDANWEADSKCVYWNGRLMHEADPTSFRPLGDLLGKDRNRVFIFRDEIPSADSATFERMCGASEVSGKDKNHCYWYDHVVPCDCKPHSEGEFLNHVQ